MTTYPITASPGFKRAIDFATEVHDGQVRKYTDTPYIQHPLNVAHTLINSGHDMKHIALANQAMLCAAVLHDTIEDCGVTRREIDEQFGPIVAEWVDDLTDRYTHEAYPDMNRPARKAAEAVRASSQGYATQTIKYADLIDNTLDIADHDPDFAKVYLPEAEQLAAVMDRGDKALRQRLISTIHDAKDKLGMN